MIGIKGLYQKYKTLIPTVFMTILILSYFIKPPAQVEAQDSILANFDLTYVNTLSKNNTIRYKYILSYDTTEEISVPDTPTPLFNLYQDGYLVSSAYLSNRDVIIPDVSAVYSSNIGDVYTPTFEVKVNQEAGVTIEDIRFEVNIVIEILVDDKWTPGYQLNFMEYGSYWSLNKGPLDIYEEPIY